jgi:predicted metal-dependent phosphoesterase TrpH
MTPTALSMRCDMHVHSRRSGRCDTPILRSLIDECYSEPDEIHETARARGMDLVTITDHNQIDGALAIAGRPDTFVSEELTLHLEEGRQLHLGVFDIDETQHGALQARRRDPEALLAYLAEQRIPAALNHPFAAMTGPRETDDLAMALGKLGLVETLNGAMPDVQNERAGAAAQHYGLSAIGGSDAHALAFVGQAHTTVPGARNKEEFLAGLRAGFTVPGGASGSYLRLAAEMARVFVAACRDAVATAGRGEGALRPLVAAALLTPVFPVIPLATFLIHGRERTFATKLFRLFEASGNRKRTSSPAARRIGGLDVREAS